MEDLIKKEEDNSHKNDWAWRKKDPQAGRAGLFKQIRGGPTSGLGERKGQGIGWGVRQLGVKGITTKKWPKENELRGKAN